MRTLTRQTYPFKRRRRLLPLSNVVSDPDIFEEIVSQSISFLQQVNSNVAILRSLSQTLTFTESLTIQRVHSRSISQSLTFTPLINSSVPQEIQQSVLQSLTFLQSISSQLVDYVETFLLSDFPLPRPERFKLYPRYYPIHIPNSSYFDIDNSLLTNRFLNLFVLEWHSSLTYTQQRELRQYILDHDYNPFILNIDGDLWEGDLLNNEPRNDRYVDGNMLFRFEVKYLGKL